MKVLVVNTYDRGGAANACLRLYQGLLDEGIDASLLLKRKQKNLPNAEILAPQKQKKSILQKLKAKLKTLMRELNLIKKESTSPQLSFLKNRPQGLELFSFPDSNFDITDSPLYQEADIINLHWVAGFLDYKSFFEKNTKPVVWTLHDMNPFTGGEHYEENYSGIGIDGFPMERIREQREKNISDKNLALKIKSLQPATNLTIVAPSQWLADEARKSEVFKNRRVLRIPYGLDSEIFKPVDRAYSREIFNIPTGKKVILFVADSISNNRKGFIFLKKAFEQLTRDDVILCAIGQKNGELASLNNVLELGPIYDERLMSVVYSAADVFVIPSLMDNLPNTVLESLMCGTPVIGFPVGGIPDMIEHGKNGLLTKDVSVSGLKDTLLEFLDSANDFNRNSIREDAKNKYDLKIQAQAYIDLFRDILKK